MFHAHKGHRRWAAQAPPDQFLNSPLPKSNPEIDLDVSVLPLIAYYEHTQIIPQTSSDNRREPNGSYATFSTLLCP